MFEILIEEHWVLMKKYFIVFLTGSFVAGRPCLPLIKGIKDNWAIEGPRQKNNKYLFGNLFGKNLQH